MRLTHLTQIDMATLPQPDIIIDGLLGTGFKGELRAETLKLIRTINRMGNKAFILSLDIPSGLNGLTGVSQPDAIMADATVTFQAAKLGLAMPGASRFTGMLHVRPIGIPAKIRNNYPVKHHLITRDIMHSLPTPKSNMHKGGWTCTHHRWFTGAYRSTTPGRTRRIAKWVWTRNGCLSSWTCRQHQGRISRYHDHAAEVRNTMDDRYGEYNSARGKQI